MKIEKLQVPPYGNFILINFSAVNENKLKNWLSSIHIPESNQSMKVFGPMPAAITRIHKKYRYQILFKSVNDICDFTYQWINLLLFHIIYLFQLMLIQLTFIDIKITVFI